MSFKIENPSYVSSLHASSVVTAPNIVANNITLIDGGTIDVDTINTNVIDSSTLTTDTITTTNFNAPAFNTTTLSADIVNAASFNAPSFSTTTFNSDTVNVDTENVTTMHATAFSASSFNATITDLNVTTVNVDTESVTTSNVTTLTATNFNPTVTSLNVNTAAVTTENVTTANVTTLTASTFNPTVTSLNVNTATVTTENVTTANVTTLTASSFNPTVTSLNVNTATVTTENVTTANVTTGNVTTANVTTENVVTENVTTLNASNITLTNAGSLYPIDIYGPMVSVTQYPWPNAQLCMGYCQTYAPTTFSATASPNLLYTLGYNTNGAANMYFDTQNNLLSFPYSGGGSGAIGQWARFFSSVFTPCLVGQSLTIRFAALFRNVNADTTSLVDSIDYVGFGYPTAAAANTFYSGVFVGQNTGVAWGSNFAKLNFSVWSNGTPTTIYQNAWNVDKMDGTGPSGMVLDWKKLNIYEISYGYIGAGNIVFKIYNPTKGVFNVAHIYTTANTGTVPNLLMPSGQFLQQTTKASANNLVACGSSVSAFATFLGTTAIPQELSVTNSKSFSSTTTENPVIILNNTTSYNGKLSLAPARLSSVLLSSEGNTVIIVRFYKNTVFTVQPTYTSVNTALSSMQYATVLGTVLSIGNCVYTCITGRLSSQNINLLQTTALFINPGEALLMTVAALTGAATTNFFGLNWMEYR